MLKQDLLINNRQWLIYYKTKSNQSAGVVESTDISADCFGYDKTI